MKKKRKTTASEEGDQADLNVKKGRKKPEKEHSQQLPTETSKSASSSAERRNVQLDSLQSIFATSDKADGQFTLFGGGAVADEIIEIGESPPLPIVSQPAPVQPMGKVLYFFPHFDDPLKNANSLFAEPEEPFFHNRSEYIILMNRG